MSEEQNAGRRPNPYDFVADVRDSRFFAGRRAEIGSIRDELLRLTSSPPISPVVALVGERRVGKTSLLHRVAESAAQSGILPCRVNLVPAVATDAWEFWHEVLQAIVSSAFTAGLLHSTDADAFGFRPPHETTASTSAAIPDFSFIRLYRSRSPIGGPTLPPTAALTRDLTALVHSLAGTKYVAFVLIFDEAHFLRDSADLVQQLRHVVRDVEQIGLVFSGEPPLNQMFTSPAAAFYLQARVIPVENFAQRRDVIECVLLPLNETERLLISPMTMEHLGRLSHGKPNQIRLLCHSIYGRYERYQQADLNFTIEAIDDVLDTIHASFAAQYDLRQRVDSIRRLQSTQLEALYLATRYPGWRLEDIVSLDEAFRGGQLSAAAATRRMNLLQIRQKTFVDMGLLQDHSDRYGVAGDEFVQLYLRFWYELQKFGDLSRRIELSDGPPTPFGEKVDKLVRSLAWELGRIAELMTLNFSADESPREQAIAQIRQRFALLSDVINARPGSQTARTKALADCFQMCEMLGHPGAYFLVVLAIRNLENPRESIVAEVYFRGGEPLPLLLDPLNGQAAAAKVAIEEFDAFVVDIPSLEALVKASSGRELEDVLNGMDAAEAWMIRSVRHLVVKLDNNSPSAEPAQDETSDRDWVRLYRDGNAKAAIQAISDKLSKGPRRPIEARLYNDRGYIAYEVKDHRDFAKKDLQRALELHHRHLPLTLLNLAIVAIDLADYAQAIDYINDALLLTLGRESLRAAYLRLRLMPGHHLITRHTKWEQQPANVLEAGYVNLGFAIANSSGYERALEVFHEGRELLPSSARLLHALARLYLWQRHADRADPLYRELSQMDLGDVFLRREVEGYLRLGRSSRHPRA